MIYENPTRLRIGMKGDFAGKNFRLVGRTVLGVDINGETYYWNEFNLETPTGETATLVFEDTGSGGEWRLFTTFEPEYPLTAEDAAVKQLGDRLNLTGVDVSVTLVQTSHVYRVEGVAPEGVRVGSEANYFNAEAGDVMQVVSWTGKEVEYYNGVTLSPGAVERAFSLPRAVASPMFSRFGQGSSSDDSGSGSYVSTGKFIFWSVIIVVVFFLIFGRNISTSREAAPVKRIAAVAPPLTVGASGNWNGKNYRITAHAVMEISSVGAIYERNEYELTDDYGIITLLVCGEKPGAKDWTLFTTVTPLDPPTARESAAKQIGDTVNLGGVLATIHELFQCTVKQVDNVVPAGWHQGDVRYGYSAGLPGNSLLVRWNDQGINYYCGESITPGEFTKAISTISGN